MILLDGVTLTGCIKDVLSLAEWSDSFAKENQSELIISSAFRTLAANTAAGGSSTSWHLQGRAMDFSFKDKIIFEVVSFLYEQFRKEIGPFARSTEFEVCRGKGKQHIHVAYGTDYPDRKSFTGVYSG